VTDNLLQSACSRIVFAIALIGLNTQVACSIIDGVRGAEDAAALPADGGVVDPGKDAQTDA
jgi:hypothetical protein